MDPCAITTSRPLRAAALCQAILTIVAIAPAPAQAQVAVGGGLGYQPIGLEAMMGGLPYPPGGLITQGSAPLIGNSAGMMGPIGGIGPRLPTYRGRSAMPPGRIARPGTTADTWPWPSRGSASPRPAVSPSVVHHDARNPTATARRATRPSPSARRVATSSFPVGSTVVGSTTVHRYGRAGSNFDGWHHGKSGTSMLGHDRPPHRNDHGYGFTGW